MFVLHEACLCEARRFIPKGTGGLLWLIWQNSRIYSNLGSSVPFRMQKQKNQYFA
jgi:hypothetical protein